MARWSYHQLPTWGGSTDHSEEEEFLPHSEGPRTPVPWKTFLFKPKKTGRPLIFLVSVAAGSLLLYFLFKSYEKYGSIRVEEPPAQDLPPLYEAYQDAEQHLPQYNDSLPFPEGKHAKYIFFANHQQSVGWGNVMQEMVLNGQLAYMLNRSLVFDNYVWNRHTVYSEYNGHLIPSKIPLSAMIAGPLVGGSLGPDSDRIPRAISLPYFRKICPNPTQFHTPDIKNTLGDATALQMMTAYFDKLKTMDDRCIEVPQETPQVFDFMIFGSPKILDIWPSLSTSPVLTRFGWSTNIIKAYIENIDIFNPQGRYSPAGGLRRRLLPSILHPREEDYELSPTSTLKGLLTVHIRRGDFEGHCQHFAKWSSTFNGFNMFGSLPDHFQPPPGGDTPENNQIYQNHCFPSIPRVVERIKQVREERSTKEHPLHRIYVMTNAKREWLKELKAELDRVFPNGEWSVVKTSKEVKLNKEQLYVAQTVDMYVAARSQVFLGNGFSSLTSNIVTLRMSNKIDPLDTRFW